jgi:hypothetical protein
MIALDYCIQTEVSDEYAEEEAQFDVSNFNVCDYSEEEIAAVAEEYGFDPAVLDYSEC